jgi:mRNA interferase MazF
MKRLKRGEVWLMNFDPTVGCEINKTRPAIIMSRSDYNRVSRTATVIAISTGRFIPGIHVMISGFKEGSHAAIPQIRVASDKRLIRKLGLVDSTEMEAIETQLKFYLDLN